MGAVFWIVIALLTIIVLGGIGVFVFFLYPLSINIFEGQVVRTSEEVFADDCTYKDNEEQVVMWNQGLDFFEPFQTKKEDIDIVNDGLKLHAEYFDFGSDTCVISIPGRAEGRRYGYYFDIPYVRDLKMNVLAVDPRSHALSEGKYHSLGHFESRDLDKWITILEERYGIKKVYLHCICVGTCTGLLMAIEGSRRENVRGIITEGAFYTYKETFREHMKDLGKPTFPILQMCMHHVQRRTGARIYEESPRELVKRLDTPILFLHGRKDIFSLPHLAQTLYDTCTASKKRIVWFEKGAHSHLRINNEAQYDTAIREFVNETR